MDVSPPYHTHNLKVLFCYSEQPMNNNFEIQEKRVTHEIRNEKKIIF